MLNADLLQVFAERLFEVSVKKNNFFKNFDYEYLTHTRKKCILIKHQLWSDGRAVEGGGLENRYTAMYRGFESLSLRSFDDAWRCGRAVIQRIANPSVPYGLGRFNSCRLRETNASKCC